MSIEYAECRSSVARRVRMSFWLVLIAGLAGSGTLSAPAGAQGTSASIFGQAPAGETIVAQSSSGLHRHVVVGSNGRYSLRNLPLSVYTVSLQKEGKAVDTRHNIPLTVSRGMEVDFACPNDHCAAASDD
jgi:hypothetical protein